MMRTGKLVDDVRQHRKIQHVFGDAIQRSRSPGAIAVPAQIERVDMVIVAQRFSHPIPIARVIQAAMYQDQRRLAFGAPIPELELQPVGVKEVRDGFQDSLMFTRRAEHSTDAR